jgi:hypothetical protein
MPRLDHDRIANLRDHHPVLRLLGAKNLPLIADFLSRVFVTRHRREVPQHELESLLGDHLCELAVRGPESVQYRGSASKYLDDWSHPDLPFLRKFYVGGKDEPVYDLTPATERTIEWLQSLEQTEFIGTESRLSAMLSLLRELVQEGDETVEERLSRLLAEREKLDAAIEQARRGQIERPDATRLRERFLRLQETIRRLLSDFRQVEENFRELDRDTRSRITMSQATKGAVLDEIFEQQDAISESDEGRSFRAFWELLLNPAQQRELLTLLERALKLPALESLDKDPSLARLLSRLARAGEQVQQTLSRLNEQLRRFLDDRVWLENRRVAELAHSIELHALALKDEPSLPVVFAQLDAFAPTIDRLMSRRLYTPPADTQLDDEALAVGVSDASLDALFEQSFVDLSALRATIDRLLHDQSQLSLGEVLASAPPRDGMAELIGYLKLAAEDSKAHIDDEHTEQVRIELAGGKGRHVRIPQVIFTR